MNISSIAKASGVSVATVSRVINNESGVSEELRRKTLAVIEGKGYRPRENIRRGTRIAMVVQADAPSFENFFAQVFTGVSTYALEHGVETTLLYHTPGGRDFERGDEAQTLTELLRKKRCNGAIILSPLDPDEGRALLAARIPTVLVANRTPLAGIGYIDCDCHRGALEQTEYLLRLGHRNIGFLCGHLEGVIDHQERLAAYKQAMDSAGIVPKPGWIISHTPTPVTEQAGYDQTRQLLEKHPEITAIFANNDSMAYGAISACAELGLRVPEDISVVGYDDNPTSKFYNPPLTTTRQSLRDMGAEAAQWVDLKLKNKLKLLPQKVIHGDLIVRRSCALPRKT
ncbi:LacI family DNA-binding transcriptional regulator [Geminisphaera colitermitum]|uniref:LacI family DNA-binding transcriptional regulator n=1 Tax=Geminisphaera colitermitum TaxID=1148786 RepID=UPI000158CED1|nr:LacI family DNA-binding transcriptional regulator [Geminisphaera colitermitum]